MLESPGSANMSSQEDTDAGLGEACTHFSYYQEMDHLIRDKRMTKENAGILTSILHARYSRTQNVI